MAKDISVPLGEYAIEKALQEARLWRMGHPDESVTLRLSGGTYRLLQPIIIRPEDSGITIRGTERTVISGGVRITGWKKQGKAYVAQVPRWCGRALEFRQMWVDGKKAIAARDVEDWEKMFRIINIDKQTETLYVPTQAVRKIQHSKDAEMVVHEMWCTANLRIRNIQIMGDSAAVTFHQPESHVHFQHPWPQPMVTKDGHNSAFYLRGAKELLDREGEWYLDKRQEMVYYIPRKGENMTTADVEVPALETVLKVEGTAEGMVEGVNFENISFQYASWLRPSICGHAPLQAGMYMLEAYKVRPKIERPDGDHKLDNQGWVGRPKAMVEVSCGKDINFTGCSFKHAASTGLDYNIYIQGGKVSRSVFEDLGGSGILLGEFSPEGLEAHLPYDPKDQRRILSATEVSDCLIHDVSTEDWGTVGIGAGFVRNILLEHNEIYDVSYTGISVGWGWNQQVCAMRNNCIRANHIHHYARHMYDTAGIYTLGAQPHSFIEENAVESIYHPSYAHDPNHWFYLYTDEGSSGITVRNNYTEAEKYLKNANGPGNVWENNGPSVSETIKREAGIRK